MVWHFRGCNSPWTLGEPQFHLERKWKSASLVVTKSADFYPLNFGLELLFLNLILSCGQVLVALNLKDLWQTMGKKQKGLVVSCSVFILVLHSAVYLNIAIVTNFLNCNLVCAVGISLIENEDPLVQRGFKTFNPASNEAISYILLLQAINLKTVLIGQWWCLNW